MYFTNKNNEELICLNNKGIFTWCYNSPLDDTFLKILEDNKALGIKFKPSFNQDISRLPSCIKSIIFSLNSEFNQNIDNLPCELEHLELYDKFNKPLDFLPSGLKKLIINAEFNHPLNNLPAGLEYLEISGKFNYSIDNLPIGLKKLIIKDPNNYKDYYTKKCIIRNDYLSRFNQPIYQLPTNLEFLEISHKLFITDNIELYTFNNNNGKVRTRYPKLTFIRI
jgi:hypothetical protein